MSVLALHRATPAVRRLLPRLGMALLEMPGGAEIPGTFWGEPEAGLIGNRLYARPDTPLHSVLHEACHYVCMPAERRRQLHTDAGGDDDEESAVCYLQILLADEIPEMGRHRMFRDMDAWGYSFRLGSSARWFAKDAADAARSLREWGLIADGDRPTFRLRGEPRKSGSMRGAPSAGHRLIPLDPVTASRTGSSVLRK